MSASKSLILGTAKKVWLSVALAAVILIILWLIQSDGPRFQFFLQQF